MKSKVILFTIALMIPLPAYSFFFFYERDGHLLSTFIVAQLATNPNNDAILTARSTTLARMSQYPDDCEKFSAYYIVKKYGADIKDKWRNDVMKILHSFHGGTDMAVHLRRSTLKRIAYESFKSGAKYDYRTGLITHMLADSYAHTYTDFNEDIDEEEIRAYMHIVGHAFDGHAPDKIKNDKDKYKEYIKSLYSTLSGSSEYSKLSKLFKIIDKAPTHNDDYKFDLREYSAKLGYVKSPIMCEELPVPKKAVQETIDYVKNKMITG